MILDTCLFVFIFELVWGHPVVEYYGCVYDLKIIIRKANIPFCKWPGCQINATIFGKPGLWEPTSVGFPTNSSGQIGIHVPANQSFSLLQLWLWETQGNQACVFNVLKNYNGSQEWHVQFGRLAYCSMDLRIIMTLQCPTTTQPTDTTTNMIKTKVTRLNISDLMHLTSPAVKEKKDSQAASSLLNVGLAVGYFIAGITICVEVFYCCKMYQRTKSCPWCKVRLRRPKANKQDIEHNTEADQSITIRKEPKPTPVTPMEQKPTPATPMEPKPTPFTPTEPKPTPFTPKDRTQKSATQTVWIGLDSQKNK